MKRMLPALLIAALILLVAPSQIPKDFFQVVKESRRFLVNGDPYSFNAAKFREQYQSDSCALPMLCRSEDFLFVKNIALISNEAGVPRGHALIRRDKPNNQWLCLLFIPMDDVQEFGPVQRLSFDGDSTKVFMTAHFLKTSKVYRRWDR